MVRPLSGSGGISDTDRLTFARGSGRALNDPPARRPACRARAPVVVLESLRAASRRRAAHSVPQNRSARISRPRRSRRADRGCPRRAPASSQAVVVTRRCRPTRGRHTAAPAAEQGSQAQGTSADLRDRRLGARIAFGPEPSLELLDELDRLGHQWLLDGADPKTVLLGGLAIRVAAQAEELEQLRGEVA
jgi:hypothetical protein